MRAPDRTRQRARVLHIAQSIAGGVASFLEEIAPYQSQRFGAENVRFLVPTGSEAHLPDLLPGQLISFASTSRDARALLKFAQTASAVIAEFKPDIVHLHSSFAGALRLLGSARRSGARVIYCPHGWAFGMEVSQAKKQLYAAIERGLARATDAIVAVSQDEHDLAMRFGIPREKTRVVRNGIAWAPLPDREPRVGPLRLGFIGRHDRQKGLDILLETISRVQLPDVHFEIVGSGILQKGAEEGAAASNVTYHGWMTRADTLSLLNSLDALVMPSRWDAAPIVAIEAMRSGVPVIASNRGGLPEIVQHGVGGYIFDLDDPEALGLLLRGLRREDLTRLGMSARDRWERVYVADAMNELTFSTYKEVLSAKKPLPGGPVPNRRSSDIVTAELAAKARPWA